MAANFVAQLEALPVHICFIISSSLGAVAYKLPAALQPCPCPTGCSEQRPLWEPEQGTEHQGGSSRMSELCQPCSCPDTEAPDTVWKAVVLAASGMQQWVRSKLQKPPGRCHEELHLLAYRHDQQLCKTERFLTICIPIGLC